MLYNLKEQLKISLIEQGYEIEDIGCKIIIVVIIQIFPKICAKK